MERGGAAAAAAVCSGNGDGGLSCGLKFHRHVRICEDSDPPLSLCHVTVTGHAFGSVIRLGHFPPQNPG